MEYVAELADGSSVVIHSPQDLPDPGSLATVEEPFVKVMIITPSEYIGTVMDLVQQRRGAGGPGCHQHDEPVVVGLQLLREVLCVQRRPATINTAAPGVRVFHWREGEAQ